jgi:hypothetical protein
MDDELATTQKAYDAEVEHYRVRLNELRAENTRLRAALRAVMTETGTSSLAHHYARDALDVSGIACGSSPGAELGESLGLGPGALIDLGPPAEAEPVVGVQLEGGAAVTDGTPARGGESGVLRADGVEAHVGKSPETTRSRQSAEENRDESSAGGASTREGKRPPALSPEERKRRAKHRPFSELTHKIDGHPDAERPGRLITRASVEGMGVVTIREGEPMALAGWWRRHFGRRSESPTGDVTDG